MAEDALHWHAVEDFAPQLHNLLYKFWPQTLDLKFLEALKTIFVNQRPHHGLTVASFEK